MKKIVSLLFLLSFLFVNGVFAALPQEGTFEKRDADGNLAARMYVLKTVGETSYPHVKLDNNLAELIWLEAYSEAGAVQSQIAACYIWKRDDVGAAEAALILNKAEKESWYDVEVETPHYAKDVGSFSFDGNGKAEVWVGKGFGGEPSLWKQEDYSGRFSGKYARVSEDVDFLPIVFAYSIEKAAHRKNFDNTEAANADWNQEKIRIMPVSVAGANGENTYAFFGNMLEMGRLISHEVTLSADNVVKQKTYCGRGTIVGSDVRFRQSSWLNAAVLGFFEIGEELEVLGVVRNHDGCDWYYVARADGARGFVAAQFVQMQ